MDQTQESAARATAVAASKTPLLGQGAGWLFSPSHFRFKLLSGTAVGVTVIVLLAGIFLFVAIRNYEQGNLRNHTIEVIRLSSLIENDLDALEGAHRGFLLTGDDAYRETFERRRDQIQKQVDDLVGLILESSPQRKRIMKVQETVHAWLDTIGRPEMDKKKAAGSSSRGTNGAALGASILEESRRNLQSIQDEEQILLNRKTLAHEWPIQSSQMLNFLPKLERSVIEMEKEKRGFIKLNLISLAFTIAAIVSVLLALGAVVVLPVALSYLGLQNLTGLLFRLARWPLLLLIVIFGLAVLYRYGPSRREPRWQWISVGSAFAAVAWLISSALLSWYLASFADYNATYGSLGAGIGMMMWMWISAIVILFGAQLSSEIEHQTARDSTVQDAKPLGARGAVMEDTVGKAQ